MIIPINKMKKQSNLIFFLLIMLIYSSYQSSDDCSELDNDKCDQYTPPVGDDGTKQCLPVGENGKCALKSCDELSYSDCNKYNPIGSGANMQNCFGKRNFNQGEPECELKKCNEMESGYCDTFETKNNEYKCLNIFDETTGNNACSYKSCSELTNFCSNFRFEDEEYQCVENQNEDGCEKKKCSELEGNRCYVFRNEDGMHVCTQNENEDGCELKTCNQLKPDQCSHLGLYDEQNRVCFETDDKKGCEYKKCEDISPPFCYKFPQRYSGFSCLEENGKCFERQCSDYKPPNCGKFESVQEDNICGIDPENENSCIERKKKCEEYSYLSCKNFNWYNYNSGEENEECVQKEDKTGCELKSCAKMATNECGKFIPMNNDEKCILNSSGNKCEIQKCSEQDENSCNSFIPNDKSKACSKVGNECELKSKQCSDFSVDECYYYDIDLLEEDEENPNSCIPNSNNNGCELKHCEDLNPNECSKFKPIYDDEVQCISIGGKCQLLTCENLPNSECNKFITNNLEYACIPGGSGCIIKDKGCSELSVNFCKSPFHLENGEECVLNNDGTGCMIKRGSQKENSGQNNGNNGGSNNPTKSSDSKEEKKSENNSKNSSSSIIESFILKILLFLFIL